jgi:P-type E1-E2 ATPase
MIELNIPGRGLVSLEYLVSDVNGTLAVDGQLIDGIPRLLNSLRDRLEIHLLTADTHGRQLNLQAVRIQPGNESQQKAEYVKGLGAEHVVALGQGANDAGMLNAAAIGICVLSTEGVALEALHAADVLASDIYTALDLLEKPVRLVATLRK